MKYTALILALFLIAALLCSCGGSGTESNAPDVPGESAVSQSTASDSAVSTEPTDAESSEAETGDAVYLISKKTETIGTNSSVTTYEYDDSGLLIKQTSVSGSNTTTHEYGYNENGDKVSDHYKSPADEYTSIGEYDANGNIIKDYVQENPGNYTLYEYDGEGRRSKLTVYKNGEWMYDCVYTYADGKVTIVSEGVNFSKQTGIYDVEKKLLLELITDDLHRVLEYDEHDNVVMDVMEKNGVNEYCYEYSYEYSEDGRMLKQHVNSFTTVYEYDENENLQSEIQTSDDGTEISRIEYEYIAIRKAN